MKFRFRVSAENPRMFMPPLGLSHFISGASFTGVPMQKKGPLINFKRLPTAKEGKDVRMWPRQRSSFVLVGLKST